MSFNLEYGGQGQKSNAQQYVEFIRESGVDIACLQETSILADQEGNCTVIRNTAVEISLILGWNLFIQRTTNCDSNAIISHLNSTNIYMQDGDILGVEFKDVVIINEHLIDEPWGPQILTEQANQPRKPNQVHLDQNMVQAVVIAASEVRAIPFLDKVKRLIQELKDKNIAVIIAGDFNEPSHLDWTEYSLESGMIPFKVEWPVSKYLYLNGFQDSYRVRFPNEVKYPGLTWFTPVSAWEFEGKLEGIRKDRIDFIYFKKLQVLDFEIRETVLSDHSAVIATFRKIQRLDL